MAPLQRALGDALRALGLPVEARRFRPHVTLARRATGAALPPAPLHCRWAVDDVALVESRGPASGGYRVLERWPLGGGAPAPGDGP
jgi:2'-5' RNA ligase